MSKKHCCLMSSELPPCGGDLVTDISQLEDNNSLILFEEDTKLKRAKRKFKINIKESNIPIIKETWTLKKIVIEYCPYGWEKLFYSCMGEFEYIQQLLDADQYYYPETKNIFRAFDLCSPSKLKVVIIGIEPHSYSDKDTAVPHADGLAFSVNKKNSFKPQATKNMFMELRKTINGFKEPETGDLSRWAKQGVLLLNKSLTVRRGAAKSHEGKWTGFINRTFGYIKEHNPKCVFVLWGGSAKALKDHHIEDNGKFYILEGIHPGAAKNRFGGCDHFNMINQILQSENRTPIDWRLHDFDEETV